MATMTDQGNTVRTQRYHANGRATWGYTVLEGTTWSHVMAELTGFATEVEALAAGAAFIEPAPEDQTECPRAANYQHHYAPQCQSAFCKAERASRDVAAVASFVADAQKPGHEIRSRSDCGGVLVLYRRTSESPTGVLGAGMIRDTRENRAALYAAGVQVYMGAY